VRERAANMPRNRNYLNTRALRKSHLPNLYTRRAVLIRPFKGRRRGGDGSTGRPGMGMGQE